MHRIPEHLKPVQARRERLALAVLAGVTFDWSYDGRKGVYTPKRWYITWAPLKSYCKGPFETKWEAVESALIQLEHGAPHAQPRSKTHPAANA
jgi:hypothetical protein